MVSRFRRPRADLSIQVDRTELQPGDELERLYSCRGEDFRVHRKRIALVCRRPMAEDEQPIGTHYSAETDSLHMEESFLNDATVRNGVTSSTDVRLAVRRTHCLIERNKVSHVEPGITWEVTAFLDVTGARDIRMRAAGLVRVFPQRTRQIHPVARADQA